MQNVWTRCWLARLKSRNRPRKVFQIYFKNLLTWRLYTVFWSVGGFHFRRFDDTACFLVRIQKFTMLKVVFTVAGLFATTISHKEYNSNANINAMFMEEANQYIAPTTTEYLFMPLAQCAGRCTENREISGVEDCSACTTYRFMPQSTCAQCTPSRPCNACFKYKFMPINECKIRPEARKKY